MVSLYVVPVPVVVPIWAKLLQPLPEQRSTRYPVTPTLSVEAPQDRSTSLPETAFALSVPGCVGGLVSGPEVIAVAWSVWIWAAVSATL